MIHDKSQIPVEVMFVSMTNAGLHRMVMTDLNLDGENGMGKNMFCGICGNIGTGLIEWV